MNDRNVSSRSLSLGISLWACLVLAGCAGAPP